MLGRCRAAPGRCAAALWAALAARMGGHLVTAPGSQQGGQTAHQRAGLRATGLVLGNGRIAPGRCAAAPWAALAGWMGWHLVITAPGGQEDGQEGHQQAGRLPDAGQLRRSALRLPGAALGLPMCPARTQSAPAQSFKSAHVGGFWAALGGAPCPDLPYTDSPYTKN